VYSGGALLSVQVPPDRSQLFSELLEHTSFALSVALVKSGSTELSTDRCSCALASSTSVTFSTGIFAAVATVLPSVNTHARPVTVLSVILSVVDRSRT